MDELVETESFATSSLYEAEIQKNLLKKAGWEDKTNIKLKGIYKTAIASSISGLLLLLIYTFGVNNKNIQEDKFLVRTLLLLASVSGWWFIFFLSLGILSIVILRLNRKEGKYVFAKTLISEFRMMLPIIFSFYFVAYVLNMLTTQSNIAQQILEGSKIEPAAAAALLATSSTPSSSDPVKKETELNISKASLQSLFDANLSKVFKGLGGFFLVLFLKGAILFTMDFIVHYENYLAKIDISSEKISLLRLLNDLVQNPNLEDVNQLVKQVMDIVGDDKQIITFDNLKKMVSIENTKKIFNYADMSGDMTIDLQELKAFYNSTLFEQANLSKGISQNNDSLTSLDFMLNLFAIPIAIYMLVSTLFASKSSLMGSVVVFTGAVTGISLLGDSIKNLINSIIFVFFVRNFEIGDLIVIDSKVYEVKQINILTSIFLDNSIHTTFPNSKLVGCVIRNFRASESSDVEHTFDFNLTDFYRFKDNVLSAIYSHIKAHRTVFKKVKPYYSDLKVVGEDKIKASIVVRFNFEYQSMGVINERKEAFVLALNDILRSSGLVPYKSK